MNRPIFARLYARLVPAMDHGGVEDHRRCVLAGLAGRVLEIGAGEGANFRHYPSMVDVTAVEPEPYLRARAAKRAANSAARIDVVDGAAEKLEFADGAFDAAVATLVLCSVADQRQALGEIHRVLRPGGELRFYEHVIATTTPMRVAQRVLDATVWPLVAGGCHTGRDTEAAIESSGFEIAQVEERRFPDIQLNTPVSRHVLGVATRI